MLFKKKIFLTLLFFSFFTLLFARPEITLEQALKQALDNNSDLQKQALTLATAEKNFKSSWNAFLPTISLSARGTYSHGSNTSANTFSWNGSGGISFSFNGAIPSQLQQLKNTYTIEQLSYSKLKTEIENSVSIAFFSLLGEQLNLSILQENLTITQKQFIELEKKYQRGLASELEMLKAQYAYESTKPQIQKAESTYETNLSSFYILLGLKDSNYRPIPVGNFDYKTINLPQSNKLIETYLQNRYDVQLQDLLVKNAQLAYTIQKAKLKTPTLSLNENATINKSGFSGSLSASISMPINSFIPGSSDNLALKNLETAITKAEITQTTTIQNATKDITAKTQEITRLQEGIDLAQMNENIAKRAYELSQQGYNAGLISQTDQDTTRQQLISSQQQVLQAKINYITSLYNLSQALQLSVDELYTAFK